MKKCLYCKNYFFPHDNRQIYCSFLCKKKAGYSRRKNWREEYYKKNRDIIRKKARETRLRDIINRRKRDIQKKLGYTNCISCGHEIFGYKKKKKYCDDCRKIIKSKNLIGNKYGRLARHLRGKDSPNWRGGVTSLRKQIRDSFKYREWRKKVFERDNYICQKCFIRGGYLEAHHKVSFESLLIKYNIKSKEEADKCKNFWRITLGETLCKKCHNLTKRGNPKIKKYAK